MSIYVLYRKTDVESGPVHRLFASGNLNNIFTQQNLYEMFSYELDFFESEEDYEENKAHYENFFYYFILKIDLDCRTNYDDTKLFLRPQQYYSRKQKTKPRPTKQVSDKTVVFGGNLSDFEKEIIKRNMMLLSRSKLLNPDMFNLVSKYQF